jgi:CBS domain-containing protein
VQQGIIQGRKAKSTPIAQLMRTDVPPVTLEMDIEDCMKLFTEKRTRHLPVVDGARLVGLLSIGDIVSAMLQDQHNHIEYLEHYITSW